jgi:hypothetical protein
LLLLLLRGAICWCLCVLHPHVKAFKFIKGCQQATADKPVTFSLNQSQVETRTIGSCGCGCSWVCGCIMCGSCRKLLLRCAKCACCCCWPPAAVGAAAAAAPPAAAPPPAVAPAVWRELLVLLPQVLLVQLSQLLLLGRQG